MIIAVEGPSAVGKTTWCRTYVPTEAFVETPENVKAPDHLKDPLAAAQFWTEFDVCRWKDAIEAERRFGLAVCDSDPCHLYFAWGHWKAGHITNRRFIRELALHREAISHGSLGLADMVMLLDAPVDELRRRAREDKSRVRRRHETHIELIPWIKTWFAARGSVLPGSVLGESSCITVRDLCQGPRLRYDLDHFDRWIFSLNDGVAPEPATLGEQI